MTVLLVVVDEREATFFGIDSAKAPLRLTSRLENPMGGLHGRDIDSDRPGRAFGGATMQRSAMDGERVTRRWHYHAEFARKVVAAIDQGRNRQQFDRLVVVAAPRMLGLIREVLPARVRPFIAAEIAKDLAHITDEQTIRSYVPREAFWRL